jgi:two-component system cell cycle sensor histidine kinase/response regulator CckA
VRGGRERATLGGMQHPAAALEAARLRLARLAVDEEQSLERVFARGTRLIARTLDVERVGIWLFEGDRERLRCVCLYERSTDTHGTGAVLSLADLPRYRSALDERRAIVADDARTDPMTAELARDYLVPLGITSMLDAALFRHGEVAGVVCHEHVGPPRHWTEAEIGFAESVADLVALAMEQAAHIDARRALDECLCRTEEDRRLAALGRVAAAVAHDFNNLLSIVQVRAEQVLGLPGLPSGGAECARVIVDTVRRSRDLTRQLTELGRGSSARGEDAAAERAVLDEVIASTQPMLASMARDGERLHTHLAAGSSEVPLGRAALERIVVNLVANAFEASDPGGSVDLTTARVEGAEGSHVSLQVRDRGHGIDGSTRPLIFEPYFTTRRETGGCGLGLAIVYARVQRAGGFIDVDSAPGVGTTITVLLPVVRGDIRTGEADTPPGASRGTSASPPDRPR